MSEVDELRTEIRSLKVGIGEIRQDIKTIGEALKELIRIDGDQKRQDDAIRRIGHEVERNSARIDGIDKRMRDVEIATNTNTTKVSGSERLWWLLGMLATGIFTAVATGALH